MEIRELVGGDADRLVALFDAVQPGSPTAQLGDTDAADAFLGDPPSGRPTTYLHELDVHDAWRRRGVGSALVTAAMDTARRRGAGRFWLPTTGGISNSDRGFRCPASRFLCGLPSAEVPFASGVDRPPNAVIIGRSVLV